VLILAALLKGKYKGYLQSKTRKLSGITVIDDSNKFISFVYQLNRLGMPTNVLDLLFEQRFHRLIRDDWISMAMNHLPVAIFQTKNR
jgi:hypothetical protein